MNIYFLICFAAEASSASLLRGQMDEEQARRFDTFSTVAINKNAIKGYVLHIIVHCPG